MCRRAGHFAVRKYTVSKSLPNRVVQVVNDSIDYFKKSNEDPVMMALLLHSITLRILARRTFGVDFKKDDLLFLSIQLLW